MNELIGVSFEILGPLVFLLARSAVRTLAVLPGMLDPFKLDVARRGVECLTYRVLAIGLRAVDLGCKPPIHFVDKHDRRKQTPGCALNLR